MGTSLQAMEQALDLLEYPSIRPKKSFGSIYNIRQMQDFYEINDSK